MSTDEIIDKNKGKIKMLSVFVLIFSLGFACGFYYIEAEKSDTAVTIRDKSADCSALFEKSPNVVVATATATATDSVLTGETAQQTAGMVLSASDTKAASGSPAVEKRFVGSKNSTLYHTPDCQYVKRVKAENLVTFGSAAEAEAAGKKPHSCVGGWIFGEAVTEISALYSDRAGNDVNDAGQNVLAWHFTSFLMWSGYKVGFLIDVKK